MPRRISLTPEAVLAIISQAPEGIRTDRLAAQLPGFSRSTVARALKALVDEGRVQSKGRGAARVHFLPSPASDAKRDDEVVPLSGEAQAVRTYLRLPLAQRTPVGYQRQFLERYVPNQTFYLPPTLRAKLAQLGTTGSARPAGTYAREILNRLLVDLSYASSHLEGNTYSLLDTRELIEHGTRAEGKSAGEATMILNHKRAIEFLVDSAEDLGFSSMIVRNVHGCLADGLLKDSAAVGRLRLRPVLIEKSVYLPPQVPQLVKEMFALLLEQASAIDDPYEQSFFAMVHLPYLQPFEDVNKRTSRLCANIPFIRENLCPLSFVDVTERDYVDGLLGVYEKQDVSILRDVMEWAYERSSARYKAVRDSLGEPDPLRLKYRPQLSDAVRAIVVSRLALQAAVDTVRIPAQDKAKFGDMLSEDLHSLHEGNFGRYGIRPTEFLNWEKAGRPS